MNANIQDIPITFNKFYGIGNDDIEVSVWQQLYAENIDFETSREYITVNRKPRPFLTGLNAPVIYSYDFFLKNKRGVVFCLDNWDIYREFEGNVSRVVEDGPRIFAMATLWDYIIFIDRDSKPYYVPYTSFELTSWDLVPVSIPGALTINPSYSDYPNIQIDYFLDTVVVGYDRTLYRLEVDDSQNPPIYIATAQYGELSAIWDIVGMYASAGGNWKNLLIITTDWKLVVVSWEEDLETQDYGDLGIKIDSCNRIGEDIFLTSSWAVYVLNGFRPEILIPSLVSEALNSYKIKFKTKSNSSVLTNYNTRLFWIGVPKEPRTLGLDHPYNWAALISFWALRPGLPPEVNIETTTNHLWENVLRFYNILYSRKIVSTDPVDEDIVEERIYFAYKRENGEFGIDYIDYSKSDEITQRKAMLILPTITLSENGLDTKFLKSISTVVDWGNSNWKITFYSIEKGIATPIYSPNIIPSWYIENIVQSRIEEKDDSISRSLWTIQEHKIVGNKEFYSLTLALSIEQDEVERKEAIKIYGLTLNLWIKIKT